MTISQKNSAIEITVGDETLRIERASEDNDEDARDALPDDLFSSLPGV